MMKMAYDTSAARDFATEISRFMRDVAYDYSVELAIEKGSFPLFNADTYIIEAEAGLDQYAEPNFAGRLPVEIKERIRKYGLRNSHLLSIAPTGTISLAFADNASNGIEPPFAISYNRKKRMADGSHKEYAVEDHAYRVYCAKFGPTKQEDLPPYFRTALQLSAEAHKAMVEAVAPYIDTAISKTINIPADYPYDDFKDIYMQTWKAGIKGISTYRPNSVLGSVLSVDDGKKKETEAVAEDEDKLNRRLLVETMPEPVLKEMIWSSRPEFADGNESWTFMLGTPAGGRFAVFVGHTNVDDAPWPFEVWSNGSEQPRGIGALAKILSMDMRVRDNGWVKRKLERLAKLTGEPYEVAMPGSLDKVLVPSVTAAFGRAINARLEKLGVYKDIGQSKMLASLFVNDGLTTGPEGTLSWTADVINPATGDEFTVGLKEVTLPDGTTRPYSIWFSGNYPRSMDGLASMLSLDMRVADVAWIGKKLRSLLDYHEALGDFMTRVPGSKKQRNYSSSIAYVADIVINRYHNLKLLTRDGYRIGSQEAEEKAKAEATGKLCGECGNHTVIKKDGCDFCTSCGAIGSCG
jgi:ribonucleoside-diphosphate reductase alpha chain